ncbi:MAG TPA: hydrogenase nickel incorporation protein HypB [Bacteroidota bacterium]
MNTKTSFHPKSKTGSARAEANRRLFAKQKILAMNVIGSTGSGKTTLLERTIEELNEKVSIGIIEADAHNALDAQRLRELHVPVAQVITNGLCHLEPKMVHKAMKDPSLQDKEVLFIENVGGVICPPTIDLGESMKVAVLSLAEEDTGPIKYPSLFKNADVLIINKIDLLQWVSYELESMTTHALALNPDLKIFQLSAVMGHGLRDWSTWLLHEIRTRQEVVLA